MKLFWISTIWLLGIVSRTSGLQCYDCSNITIEDCMNSKIYKNHVANCENNTSGTNSTSGPVGKYLPSISPDKRVQSVCVKQEIFVDAKYPPGVKSKSGNNQETWDFSGAPVADDEPRYVTRFCGKVYDDGQFDKHSSSMEPLGGKFILRLELCKKNKCNQGVKHEQSLGIMLIIMATMPPGALMLSSM